MAWSPPEMGGTAVSSWVWSGEEMGPGWVRGGGRGAPQTEGLATLDATAI